jgi:murein DD-endopeptidase MepM/ murein hydrolase activator NlpD
MIWRKILRARPIRHGAFTLAALVALLTVIALFGGPRPPFSDQDLLAAAWNAPSGDPDPEARTVMGAATQAPPSDHIVKARPGDTLYSILTRSGVDRAQALDALGQLRAIYDPRKLAAGDLVTLTFSGDSRLGGNKLVTVRLDAAFDREAGVLRKADDSFAAFAVDKAMDLRLARTSGTIRTSLYADGIAAGVPATVMSALIRLFSYDVDFQHDLQPGDGFDILFERHFAGGETPVRDGKILYAALTLAGNRLSLYRHDGPAGAIDYYTPAGDNVQKALLRTPIDGARLSSGFGRRLHPILGFTIMHKGVDFAAPAGTPIYAAGDGIVESAQSDRINGNMVRIRHAHGVATAYAHMKAIARGVQRGARVRQGQIIGTVGTTGRSTGPHLHYEVRKAGQPVNPLSVQTAAGQKLAGRDLRRFRAERDKLDRLLQELPAQINVADGR